MPFRRRCLSSLLRGCRSSGLGHPLRKISSRSNGCCYPFEKNLHPLERLRSSVRIKFSSVQTAEVICLKKSATIRTAEVIRSKKSSSVRTAEAIRSSKIFIRSKSQGYPFEKMVIRFLLSSVEVRLISMTKLALQVTHNDSGPSCKTIIAGSILFKAFESRNEEVCNKTCSYRPTKGGQIKTHPY